MVSAISLVGSLRQFLLFANTPSPHTIRSCARRKVRSSFCPFDKMFVRQSVRQQNVRSAKCLSAKCLSAKCPGTVLVFLAHRHYVSSTLFSAGKPFQYMFSIVWKRRSVFFSRSSYLVTGSFAIIAPRFLHLVQDVGFFFCIDLRNYVLSPTTFDFPKRLTCSSTSRHGGTVLTSTGFLEHKVRIVCVLRLESCCFSVNAIQLHPNGPSLAIGLPGSPRTSALEYTRSALSTPINKST